MAQVLHCVNQQLKQVHPEISYQGFTRLYEQQIQVFK